MPSQSPPESTIPTRVFALILGQRLKKMSIGLRSRRLVSDFSQLQPPACDADDGVGRQDIDAVWHDFGGVLGDGHGQIRVSRDNLVQKALTVGAEMGDHDEREARLGRHALEQTFERFNAAGGRAHANNGKCGPSLVISGPSERLCLGTQRAAAPYGPGRTLRRAEITR